MKTKQKKYRVRDILEGHLSTYLGDPKRRLYVTLKHLTAINWLVACRTAKLGIGHYSCDNCDNSHHYMYRSCQHRFCPTCGVIETNKWSEKMLSNLLEMKHHHVVMTLPKPLRNLSKKNGDKIHNELFTQSKDILKSWFRTRHRLKPGIVSVLHTSGSDLKYHPHVHMIVSGGGKELYADNYRELKGDYLVPQYFLGNQLRIRMIKALTNLHKKGELKVHDAHKGDLKFETWLRSISPKHWVVNIQKPLKNVNSVVRYVGRYTKRCCLSEYKIEEVGKDVVRIRYNDYKNSKRGEKAKQGIRSFTKTAFMDELLQHVPNKGYQMVRYYGLYSQLWKIPDAQKHRKTMEQEVELEGEWMEFEGYRKAMVGLGRKDPFICEYCGEIKRLKGVIVRDGEYIESG